MAYCKRVEGRISKKDKEILDAIKKGNSKISVRYIVEEFIKDYCSTNPPGVKIEIKEMKKEIKEIDQQINKLYEDRTKLEIKIKTYEDKLNTTLDIYIDDNLIKSVDSILESCKDNNIERFKDIPEQIFINIAKYNKIELETLKEEVRIKF
jgi:chromosome segregation ATPase